MRGVLTIAAAAAVIATPLTQLPTVAHAATSKHAAPTTIVAPTYVRTIGGQTEAITYPSGLAVDSSGNVYVADTGNYRIEKWAAGTGTPTPPLWSVGVRGAPIGGGIDSFQAPRAVGTDGTFVYVADTDNALVQVLNASDGSFVKQVKAFGSGQKFADPIGVTVGSDGSGNERILVSDGVSGNVYVFDASFNLTRTIVPTASNEGTRDAATDSAGTIYTADYRGNTVDTYSLTNNGPTPTTSWGGNSTDCHDVAKPYGVSIDTADIPNRIYVASSNLEQVRVFDPSGNCLNVGATGANSIGTATKHSGDPTALFQLRRVAVGAGSNPLVYAADLWGLKILTYNSSDGTIASTAQPVIGDGQYPPAGNLNEPHGLALAPGTSPPYIFTTNTVNQRIERFNLVDGSNPFDWGTKGVAEGTASFNWAQGIGFDAANGNVWVANTRNNRIDEFTTAGSKVGSFPPAGRLNSIFNWPMAVIFDPAGNMYVADTFHNQVDAFSVTGTTVNATPLWKSAKGQFTKPWGLAYDATQSPPRLLVADEANNRIVSLNASTGALNGYPINVKGTAPGQVIKPQGVAVDAAGNIWVADTGNNRIEEFTSTGVFANQMIGSYGISGNTSFNAPQSISFDNASPQLLYVTDPNNNRIQVFQPATGGGGGPPTYQRQIYNAGGVGPMYPAGGKADASGNMFIADSGGSRIDKIDSGGNLSYIVPSSGNPLANPRNLSIDSTTPTDLWVTDTGNNGIVEMDTTGNVLTRFDASSTPPLILKSPFGNANDSLNVYVADAYNHRIVIVSKANGQSVPVYSCAVATPTALSRVRDVTVGSDGNIYAVDTDNNRVVEFSPAGACLSSWDGSTVGHKLSQPRALTSDGNGGLWVADAGGNPTLFHFGSVGTTPVFRGSTTNGGSFLEPEGVFTDGASVVIADPFIFELFTFTVDGSGVPSATGTALYKGSPVVGGFNNPYGVAYAPNGDCFVSDQFNQRIEKFPKCAGSGATTTGQFGGGNGNMQNPRAIAVSPDGLQLILTNSENERIDLFSTVDLHWEQSITPACGKLYFPDQTAFDSADGTYWIADTNNNRILQVKSDGTCVQNWTGAVGLLNAPRGIAWDGTNVWISNTGAGQVLKCSPDGTTCTVMAARSGTPTKIQSPWSLTYAQGNIWMADQTAGKVVVMALDGSTVFTLGAPGTGPGQLTAPRSVAVSATGQVAIADFTANLISIWQ